MPLDRIARRHQAQEEPLHGGGLHRRGRRGDNRLYGSVLLRGVACTSRHDSLAHSLSAQLSLVSLPTQNALVEDVYQVAHLDTQYTGCLFLVLAHSAGCPPRW